ncbi:Protein of unknown function [Lactobacillus delbrueckii subsp. lactis]|nr:Protein of unknown function [Lactobacillus delbrueckii subsp. lactis]
MLSETHAFDELIKDLDLEKRDKN